MKRRTGRWTGVAAVALLLAGAGAVVSRPGLVVAGVVAVAFAGVATASRPPDVSLSAERTVSDPDPDPGDPVRVTVSVTNEGGTLLADLRLLDGVPDALVVADGAPRHGTALRPGRTATFSYTVTAERGVHRFETLTAVGRDIVGGAETRIELPVETTVECVPRLPTGVALGLRPQTAGVTGRVETQEGGPGVAFHAVREYRRGDPLNRIDWKRAARTGELSTVEFQRERSADVVVVVDAREEAYLGPEAAGDSAVDRSVSAAGALCVGLLEGDNRVGLGALSPREGWLAPGSGPTHRSRLRETLATAPALSPEPPTEPFYPTVATARLRRRLPADAQVVLCSPLCDDYPERLVRRLEAYGHHVTVVSPDPTTRETTGGQLVEIERRSRASTLRERGVPVVEWAWADEALAAAVSRAGGRR